jgi:glycine betaine/proline transport system ATP-binding protein
MTAKLEIQRLFKVYGSRPDEAIRSLADGSTPSEIFKKSGQVVAVADVSFQVRAGEIFTIMGLSGSGKSTLVRCINRIIDPSAGSIHLDGEDVTAMSRAQLRALRRSKVAMVFQGFALLPHKTVHENVEFGLAIRGEPEATRKATADAALERVGLSGWGSRYPDNLSGGMKQRVGLARALASDPDVLLMDEPFSAVDPLIRSELQRELLKLQREIKKTIVFITHDFHEAVRLSDRLAVMRDGRFVQVGSPQDIVLRPFDDYVGTFARDLDRSKILSAGDVAHMRVPLVRGDAPATEALAAMRRKEKGCALVVDAKKAPLGYVFRGDLDGRSDLAGRATLEFRQGTVNAVPCSSPLTSLYPLLDGRFPLAVLDADGNAVGALDASDILKQLIESTRGDAALGDGREPEQASGTTIQARRA